MNTVIDTSALIAVLIDEPEKQKLVFRKVLTDGLSVRQTEALVKRTAAKKNPSPAKKNSQWDPLTEELQRILGTKACSN